MWFFTWKCTQKPDGVRVCPSTVNSGNAADVSGSCTSDEAGVPDAAGVSGADGALDAGGEAGGSDAAGCSDPADVSGCEDGSDPAGLPGDAVGCEAAGGSETAGRSDAAGRSELAGGSGFADGAEAAVLPDGAADSAGACGFFFGVRLPMACSFHRKSARVQLPSLAGRNTYPYATALCPGCRASAALSRAAMTGFFTTVSCVVRSTAVRCSAALPAATRSADMPSTALSTVTFPSDALVLNAWTTCSVVFSTRTLTTIRVPSCPEQTADTLV